MCLDKVDFNHENIIVLHMITEQFEIFARYKNKSLYRLDQMRRKLENDAKDLLIILSFFAFTYRHKN